MSNLAGIQDWLVDEAVRIYATQHANKDHVSAFRRSFSDGTRTPQDAFRCIAAVLRVAPDLSDEFKEKAIQHLLEGTDRFLSAENYDKYKKFLPTLSDRELAIVIAEELGRASEIVDEDPGKLRVRLLKDMAKIGGLPLDSKWGGEHIGFVDEVTNLSFIRALHGSEPSDVIKLTKASDLELITLWEGDETHDRARIPSDLFFANTIPLKDFRLVVDETEDGGTVNKARIKIYDDFRERIDKADVGDEVGVGLLQITPPSTNRWNTAFIIEIYVISGFDEVVYKYDIGHMNMPQGMRSFFEQSLTRNFVGQLAIAYMETWYGIQIALLHPVVKEVFANYSTVRDYDPTRPVKRQDRRKVKYIKQRIIKQNTLAEAIYGKHQKNKIKRHALIWYVCGHWRTYKNGRKIFIQPYWKGALRETKKALEAREREIVINEEYEKEGETA